MTLIIFKAASIGDAAFNAHWWIKYQPNLTKALCMIIQRSQRQLNVTMGGLWILNLETYTSVSYDVLLIGIVNINIIFRLLRPQCRCWLLSKLFTKIEIDK